MSIAHQVLPAERPGVPADLDLEERRSKFAATTLDEGLGVALSETEFAGVPCLVLAGGDVATVLYLHGGGYRMGSPEAYIAYGARLAHAAGATIVVPHYRLAPENPFPAGLRDAAAVYEELVGEGDGPVMVAGDSAGAGLAAAVVATALRSGLRPAAGLMLLSPWLDVSCESPYFQTAPDVFFAFDNASTARDQYLQGASADDPLASPVRGDLAGFPPTLVQVGSQEALVGDALDLARGLAAEDVSCTLEVVAGQGHTWPLIFPQTAQAAASIASWGRFVAATAAESTEALIQ